MGACVEGLHHSRQRGLRRRGRRHGMGGGAVRGTHVDHLDQLRAPALVQSVQAQPLVVHRCPRVWRLARECSFLSPPISREYTVLHPHKELYFSERVLHVWAIEGSCSIATERDILSRVPNSFQVLRCVAGITARDILRASAAPALVIPHLFRHIVGAPALARGA